MSHFSYHAINENGHKVNGTLESDSLDTANSLLVSRGLIPVKVIKRKHMEDRCFSHCFSKRFQRIAAPDLIIFTKQFKTMIAAGIPMLSLLRALENQTENNRLKCIVASITQDIKEGTGLYEAFRKYPHIFSPLYCAMIRAGEASGALPQILERLVYLIEHEYRIKSDIRSALQYPAIVLISLVTAFFILLTVVVPKFAAQYARTGTELPLITRICVQMYQLFSHYWPMFFLLLFLIITGSFTFFQTHRGRFLKDRFLIQLPLLGPLFVKSSMSRFASIFSILQKSGIAVLDSMRILTITIGNSAIAREFEKITERLEEGRGISVPLRSAKYFTPIVINMVAIGEDSGNLEEMLYEVSQHYDAEMEYGMKKLSAAIGPILTIGLAVLVGFFALAIYLPMWNIAHLIK